VGKNIHPTLPYMMVDICPPYNINLGSSKSEEVGGFCPATSLNVGANGIHPQIRK